MSRPIRIEFDGAWYHATNRGQARRRIVKSDADRKIFFDVLDETVKTYGIEVHGFSLLDNQYHLLIHTPRGGLSRAMRHLNGVFTKKINKAWRSDGPVFRGRYQAKIVDSENYLLDLIRFIHLNPVKAKICQKPYEHRWTSQGYYTKRRKRPDWLSTGYILERFGLSEAQAINNMNRFMNQGVPIWFHQEVQSSGFVLGTTEFREWIFQNHIDDATEDVSLKIPKAKIPVKEILKEVSLIHDVPISEIRKSSQGLSNEARSMAIYLCRQLSGLRQKDLATWFNNTNRYTIAKSIQRYKDSLRQDKSLRSAVNDIEAKLSNKYKNSI